MESDEQPSPTEPQPNLSEDENDAFEDLPQPPTLRKNRDGDDRRKPDRIKSWYIKGSSNIGAIDIPEPSAILVTKVCDIDALAAESDLPLHDSHHESIEPPVIQSLCSSKDGNSVFFLLNRSSRLYRYSDNQLSARTLHLTDLAGKRLQPRHLCIDEDDEIVFISGEVEINKTTSNVLARFRLPDNEAWLAEDKQAACKYLGRTKMFEDLEKFGSLDFQKAVKQPRDSADIQNTDSESKEQKENEPNEQKENEPHEQKENEGVPEEPHYQAEDGLWIASPQLSHNSTEKSQIFKLTTDFKHKRCSVNLGRHGVCYVPRQLSIDEKGWVYLAVDRVESRPHGSTKLWNSRLLTFPSRPTTSSSSSEHIRDWMRVNSWHFEGLTPGAAVAVKPGESVLVIDRDRGCLHKVTWHTGAIEGHGNAECFPVFLQIAGTDILPTSFDGIARFGQNRVLLYKDLELFQLQIEDLK